MQILVVDDQSHVRNMLVPALGAKGFSVSTAENGADGLKLFRAAKFDLVSPISTCRAWMA
jgi:DNA-binding response OmpR family regulator